MTLQRAILLFVASVLLVGLVPAGLLMDRGVSTALEDAVRRELAHAPAVVEERWMALASARMMHAKELSSLPGLAEAMAAGDREGGEALVSSAPSYPLESPVLVDADGTSWMGTDPGPALLEATRRGEMPVSVVPVEGGLRVVALSPVLEPAPEGGAPGRWLGAAGVEIPMDEAEATVLAGLTRSDVVILGPGGEAVASNLPMEEAELLAREAPPADAAPSTLTVGDRRALGITGGLDGGAATLFFVRDPDVALGAIPTLRRLAVLSGVTALLLSLLVGALFAGQLSRPVEQLAEAAEGMALGDFDRPLSPSPLTEVNRLHGSFFSMRRTLETRLRELNRANGALKDRQARLGVLQAELVQRDRLASGGRLLASLAHEIRNPVANVRNCLEVLRRRVAQDPEASEFADMAIDELLRMHELAEQMLDLHRPREGDRGACGPVTVARRVALLAGSAEGTSDPAASFHVLVQGDEEVKVDMGEQAMTQVLLNLVNNARDAMGALGVVEIRVERAANDVVVEVEDRGPGIPSEDLPRIFDPFFTTKSEVRGVGLGLFTAEGIVRSHGGRISASNRPGGGGAVFRIEIPISGGGT